METAFPDALPLYGVQLVDAYLRDARISRREKREGDEDGPTLEASMAGWGVGEDEKVLDVSVAVKALVPYRDGEFYLEIECATTGRFVSSDARGAVFWNAFASREALAVLWPYVRASASELGRMTGLPVPVLPTLDVKAILPPTPEPPAEVRPKKGSSRKPAKTKSSGGAVVG